MLLSGDSKVLEDPGGDSDKADHKTKEGDVSKDSIPRLPVLFLRVNIRGCGAAKTNHDLTKSKKF